MSDKIHWSLRSSATFGISVGTVSVLLIIGLVDANAGTMCKCERHKAEAEANGTCSRTEDSRYCTLAFSATPKAYRKVFRNFLSEVKKEVKKRTKQDMSISTNVDETLMFAFSYPSRKVEC